MCLKYIGERTSTNEGIGYKYLWQDIEGRLTTVVLNYPVLADCWLLHKEPETCAYSVACVLTSRVDFLISEATPSALSLLPMKSYDHGFHLYKNINSRFSARHCSVNKLLKRYRVYYKNVIAEDDTQIVVKQIYICDKTTKPAKIEDVRTSQTV